MNVKKLAFAGVVALVVLGCVLAAGCTSTPQTSSEPIVGTWSLDMSKLADATSALDSKFSEEMEKSGVTLDALKSFADVKLNLNADGSGKMVISALGFTAPEMSVPWKKTDAGTYVLTLFGSDVELSLDDAKTKLADSSSIFSLKKQA
ncbi:MAG TPA: hypothetical protein O0X27_03765 [Methanocorpusculum sp.]|nr:hypothetical protein [Methanocorpusculum sp.]